MAEKLTLEQFAAEILKRRPDLAHIPQTALVAKTLQGAPELKEFVNLDLTMPEAPGTFSSLFSHLGVRKEDPAGPTVKGSSFGPPVLDISKPSVASEGAAQSLVGMGHAVKATPSGISGALSLGFNPSPKNIVAALSGLYNQGKEIIGPMISQPEPGSPEWQKAQQGAGGALIAAETPNVIAGVASPLAKALSQAIPSGARASANYETAMAGARNIPLELSKADIPARRALELAGKGRSIGRGNTMPKVMSDYIRQRGMLDTLNIEGNPMTYEVGRDFASAAGDLSAGEKLAANRIMRRQVTQLAKALDEANQVAADKGGVGAANAAAQAEYRRLMIAKSLLKNAGKAAVGGTAFYQLHKALSAK